MRVNRDNDNFPPVTITLESQEEYDRFIFLLNEGITATDETAYRQSKDELFTENQVNHIQQTVTFGEDLYDHVLAVK